MSSSTKEDGISAFCWVTLIIYSSGMSLVCVEHETLSDQRVQELYMFLLANEEEYTISVPPAHPKGGDV